jgi:hypothetical protein
LRLDQLDQLVTMVHLLHGALARPLPCRHQQPHSALTDVCAPSPHRPPCHQWSAHLQSDHGAIPLLHGPDLYQHRGPGSVPQWTRCLYCQFRTYDKQDPSPTRVCPVPLQLLVHLHATITQLPTATDHQHSINNLVIMAFCFLLCPREYCKSSPDTKSHPFQL